RDQLVLMEAVLTPRSRLIGRKVRDARRLGWYGAAILAVQRHGRNPDVPTAERALQAGDLVLVEGRRHALDAMQRAGMLMPITRLELPREPGRWWLATGILVVVVLLAALDVLPMSLSVLLGVIAMAVTGCIEPADAYERVGWSGIILIGRPGPLGL